MAGSNTTKFTLEADAAKAVQEFLKLRDAEKKVDEGQRALAGSARAAETAVVSAAKGMAREYEIAGEQMKRAMPLPRTFGGTFVPRARSGFDLQALPSSVLRGPAGTVPLAGGAYAMRSDVAADLNLEQFNALLERGNKIHQQAITREQFDLEQRERNVEYYGAKQRQAELGLGDFTRAMGLAGVAFYGIASLGEKVVGRFDELRNAAIDFNDVMRPVLSLGNNMKVAPELRQQVLDLSGAYGIQPGEVAGANFMVQSAGSNFGAGQRNAIVGASLKLAQVTGGSLQTGLVAVTKLVQSYGKELGTAEAAASKLLYTEDRAAITIDELSSLLPDVLPAAKMLGLSYDEIAAATIVATQSMGNNEKTLTAERNMFLELNKAVDAGIIKQGSLNDELQQVNELDPSVLQKMFGQRTISLVAALRDHLKEFRQELENIKNMPRDLVSRKAAEAYTDPGSAMGLVLKGTRSTYQNIDIAGGVNPSQQMDSVRMAMTELGWKSKLPIWMPGAKYIGDLDFMLHQTHILGDVGDPEGLKYGLKTKYDQDIAAGNFNEAYYLRTAFSEQFHKS